MQLSLKSLIAAVGLTLASTAALAQVTVPPQPAPGPFPGTGTGNGGLMVTIWDATANESLVVYLGLNLNQIGEAAMTPETGLVLDFGNVSGYSALFGNNNAANIRYHVSAADSQGSGPFAGRQVAFTVSETATSYSINNAATTGAANSHNQFITNGLNSVSGCNGVNPCVATDPSLFSYAGNESRWGSRLGGQLPLDASANVGTALRFAVAATSSNTATQAANVQLYQNSPTSYGRWLLTATGGLTYQIAPVPLPAALWLLLSGLVGVGAVSRRRS